ncbi:hypothetical protein EYF80_067895 [Liparis tanakae]|uniref:Uncharacterized protein n=1 Tax=Liparis tanakae TaxID=230148 RepID=A0A4Z2DZM3_9TELE|nr:hypothetical protein EYF80_067895 [Liparis tanakae]
MSVTPRAAQAASPSPMSDICRRAVRSASKGPGGRRRSLLGGPGRAQASLIRYSPLRICFRAASLREAVYDHMLPSGELSSPPEHFL